MHPLVMGVLNVTPDSFSDGGRWLDHQAAISHGLDLINQGADIIDIGGESTRPGARPVLVDEEIARVIPVVEALSVHSRVSIDTRKPEVAAAAARAGAAVINDVSAELYQVAADLGTGWVAMHMMGEPQTMQKAPMYSDVVGQVSSFLFERAEKAVAAGVSEVFIDPGIGFGKTLDHNLSLLKHLDVLTSSPFPVAIGTSRKSFLGILTGDVSAPAPPEDRLEASLVSAVWAMEQGAAMVRVHDVRATVRARRVVTALLEAA